MVIVANRRKHHARWTPANLAVAPTLWLESSTITGAAGDPISTWAGRVSNDATSSSTARPVIDDATFSARVVSFDGSNDVMTLGSSLNFTSGSFTVYMLIRRFNGSSAMWGLANSAAQNNYAVLQFTDGKTYMGSHNKIFSANNPALGWNLCCYQWNGSGSPSYFVDTSSSALTDLGATGSTAAVTSIGARTGLSEYGKGYAAFFMFCPAVHTSTERGLVEQYVKSVFPSLVQY